MTALFDSTHSVKKLTGADFENFHPWKLKKKGCAVVLFYANWCGHCQQFKSEYVKFADMSQFVNVYAVDSDAQQGLLKAQKAAPHSPVKIQGFPTIWMYKGGSPHHEYTGERTVGALVADVAKMSCAPSRRVTKD